MRDSWAAVPPRVREALRQHVFARDGWHCRIRLPGVCRHRDGCTGCAEHLDHIVPRKNGGAVLDPSNCRAACQPCNHARGRRQGRSDLQGW